MKDLRTHVYWNIIFIFKILLRNSSSIIDKFLTFKMIRRKLLFDTHAYIFFVYNKIVDILYLNTEYCTFIIKIY